MRLEAVRELTKSHLSPSSHQLFTYNQKVDPAAHLEASQAKYEDLQIKIHKSVTEGKLIHVEDGEADDLWHDLLVVQQGVTPQMVLLSGGYYKVRAKCANIIWDYLAEKSGIKKPKIMTVYASTGGGLQTFDKAEGTGLLEVSEIMKLKEESLNLNHQEYLEEVNQARESLRKTLQQNDFTTIALKTSPAGILDIIEEFKHKVAVIWTGPVDRLPNSPSWAIKFNYSKAPEAGDDLLDIGVPIIMVSPKVGNGRMHSIVDKQFMAKNLELLRKFNAFLPTDQSFAGFDRLANIALDPNAKFSHYIFSLADSLRDQMINAAQQTEKALDIEAAQFKRELQGEELRKKLDYIDVQRTLKLPLGQRWEALKAENTPDSIFREFCPVDQTLQLVSDPEMKNTVTQVVEVEMKRLDKDNDKLKIQVKPKQGSNLFLITQIDTKPLEAKNQSVIKWMADGEKSNPRDIAPRL
ncbi:hypothetical protein VP01_829g3 [Puccinia sorghi]|uniref:Uncharacterized protein n=1 Tax=Puccinia sorghi TaxID=27349 RepID=A0A0L6UAJ8_9BASI|nr:hypothetical protein VP01_829g3 [Puccinia sorghi]